MSSESYQIKKIGLQGSIPAVSECTMETLCCALYEEKTPLSSEGDMPLSVMTEQGAKCCLY